MNKTLLTLFVAALCFALGIIVGLKFLDSTNRDALTETSARIDTLFIEKTSPPVIIKKALTRVKYISDTVYKSPPFTARFDTIILRDTVMAEFDFPANTLSLELRKRPDTTIYALKTVALPAKERSWWETPLYIIAGAACGYFVKSLNEEK